jgi:hypothetical protein
MGDDELRQSRCRTQGRSGALLIFYYHFPSMRAPSHLKYQEKLSAIIIRINALSSVSVSDGTSVDCSAFHADLKYKTQRDLRWRSEMAVLNVGLRPT